VLSRRTCSFLFRFNQQSANHQFIKQYNIPFNISHHNTPNFIPITQINASDSSNQKLFLKISSPLHQFPFVGSTLEVTAALCSDSGKVVTGHDVHFHLSLLYSDDEEESFTDPLLEVLNPQSQRISSVTGKSGVIRIRLLQCTHPDRDVFLCLAPSQTSSHLVTPFTSRPMRVVRYQMELCNIEEVPSVWFKDEGGKANQIVLRVRLVDGGGSTVLSRAGLRVHCVLLYEDEEVVASQEVLDVSPDSHLYLSAEGVATIRCRITEISGNHNFRKFKILVATDTQSGSNGVDVSYCCTPSILVKSKISKKNRERRMQKEFGFPPPLVSPTEVAGRKRKNGENHVVRSVSSLSGATSLTLEAALQFADFAVMSLARMREEFQLSEESPIALIDAILEQHRALTAELTHPPPRAPRSVSVPVGEEEEDDFEQHARSVLGPDPWRENSLFLPPLLAKTSKENWTGY